MNRYSVSELLTLFMVNTHKPPTLVLQGVNLINYMNFIDAPNKFYLPSSLLILKKILKSSVVTLKNSENAVPLCRVDKFSRHFRKCENSNNIYYIFQSCLCDCFSVSLFICNHKTQLPSTLIPIDLLLVIPSGHYRKRGGLAKLESLGSQTEGIMPVDILRKLLTLLSLSFPKARLYRILLFPISCLTTILSVTLPRIS